MRASRDRDKWFRRSFHTQGRKEKLVLVMVGMPGRGKSYIAHKLVNYLQWTGKRVKLFNVGAFRRESLAGEQQLSNFFSPQNLSAKTIRDELAFSVLKSLLQWLDECGDVAVFDATNTTNERRRKVLELIKSHSDSISVIFIESICNDEKVLESNFRQKIENSPDYSGMPLSQAIEDLRNRIKNYESVYEPIDDDQLSYIKLINLQSKVICNRIYGRLAQRIVGFLMAIHIGDRPIWLTRAGHCDEVTDLDPEIESSQQNESRARFPSLSSMKAHLSTSGQEYAQQLNQFICKQLEQRQTTRDGPDGCSLMVYTSTLPRALETTQAICCGSSRVNIETASCLKMINTGVCSGMTVEQMKDQLPAEWNSWKQDPFRYRFVGGESYKDVVQNVEPLVLELERLECPVLVVSHLSTLQVLFGYFVGCPVDKFCSLSIPRHTVIQLVPNQYGWKVDRFHLEP